VVDIGSPELTYFIAVDEKFRNIAPRQKEEKELQFSPIAKKRSAWSVLLVMARLEKQEN